MEIDHDIISMAILLLLLIQEELLSVTSSKYVHEVLVNNFVKLVQEIKVWLGYEGHPIKNETFTLAQ